MNDEWQTIETEDRGAYVRKVMRWTYPDGTFMDMEFAEAADGGYIGEIPQAERLIEMGIAPQRRKPGASVCDIGFCEREQRWYGWSHRAIAGFGIGDVVDGPNHACAQSGWIEGTAPPDDPVLPMGFKAETLEDARRMAEAFAESVG